MIRGVLAGLAAGALWGLVFVVPRMVPGLSAVDLTAGRFVSFGAVSLLAMLLAGRSVALPTARQALAAAGLSVLGFTGYYLLLVMAINDAGTEVPTLIIGTIPLWMMVLGKPAGLRWPVLLPGMLLTMLGLALMTQTAWQDAAAHAGGGRFWQGIGLATAAMAAWTAFGLLNAAWLSQHPEVSAGTWANWLGVATGLGALGLWAGLGSAPKVLLALDSIAWSATLCIVTGVLSAWLATILWNIASQRLSASLCGQLIVSETVFALVYSFAWDGAWPAAAQLAACMLFIAGILAGIRAHR
jgi:drug/metabolite transporter (DMT)-like permease